MALDTIWQDVRHGLRLLRSSPSLAIVGIGSLALGIGASVTMFLIVNAALLRPVPVRAPEELVYLFTGTAESPYRPVSYPDYVDYRDSSEVFRSLSAYGEIEVSLADEETPERVRGLVASGNFFETLGVRAGLGRTFTSEEDRAPGEHPVAVLSHGLWERRFGADPQVAGREIVVNGHPYVVLGVTPRGFRGPDLLESYDVYVPMSMQAQVRPPRAGFAGEMDPDLLERRGASWLRIVGRLAPGVSIDQAEDALRAISQRLEDAHPDTNEGETASLYPLQRIDPRGYPVLRSIAVLLLSVACLVLLVATANVTNLLLSRAIARRREIAVRLSLGGSRGRLVRQLLTESLLLAAAGGGLGLLLASWALDGLGRLIPATGIFSFTLDFEVDARVLAFTALASLVSALLVGLAPAIQSSRPDLVQALRGGGSLAPGSRRTRWNGRKVLVLVQVALSIVLLVGAGLFLRSFRQSSSIAPGFAADEILTAPLSVDLLRYTTAQGQRFYREVVERVAALPGVRAASVARVAPLQGGRRTDLFLESHPAGQELDVYYNIVGRDYLRTTGIALVAGRGFSAADVEGAPLVALANESFAGRHLPEGGALGKRVKLGGDDSEWREIVGVVRDSKYRTLGEEPTPYLYVPVAQQHETGMILLVRTESAPELAAGPVREVLLDVEPNLPVSDLRPLDDLVAGTLFPARMAARLLSVFAALAVVLAATGLYGVMSFAVSRRTREMGIRVALGARPQELTKLVVGEGLMLVLAGIAAGWLAAFGLSRLLASFLYGVSPSDPATFVAVGALLVTVMLATTYLPARRAARSNPLAALRYE